MKSISNISSIATEETNTAGVMSPILEVQPRDGTTLLIRNAVDRGQQRQGFPIYAELKDSNGDDLPLDTRVAVRFEAPADDDARTVSEPYENIRSYRSLSITEQQDADTVDRVKHVLKNDARGLQIDDVDKLYISVESSEQIDWSNSRVQIDESAVTEA